MNTFQHRLIPAFVVVALAAIFLCCITAAGYSSADNADVEADIEYIVSNDSTYAIVSNCLNEKEVTTATIASTYNDIPVTTIKRYAFQDCSSLASIAIPSSVTEIGVDALSCPNLRRIITTLDIQPGDYGSPSTVSIINPQKEEVPKSSTIIFNAGEGTGSASSVTANYGSTICLPSSGFTREGYILAAWATTIDGTTVYYPIGSTYTFRDDDSTRTFTAHYVANHGTIIFDVNGGTATDTNATVVVTDSSNCIRLPNSDSFPRSDYTLIGWSSKTEPNIVYPVGYSFLITAAASTIVMKAVWVPKSTTLYNIEFQPNFAQYTNATGTPFICKAPAEMTIATPTMGFMLSGYTPLSGWNTQPDCKGTAYSLSEGVKVTGNLMLYAQYPKNPSIVYTITFNPSGGHVYSASQSVIKGDTAARPKDPDYPQYVFLGWKTPNSTSYYDWNQPVMSDMILVAQWEKMFDVAIAGNEVTITPVGNYAVTGVHVDWNDESGMETATASGLSHEFPNNSSGKITVYSNGSISTYEYKIGPGKESNLWITIPLLIAVFLVVIILCK